ncbi:peritrophin-48 [Drosophila biarmipes]|uniref:peritrophin-48 n=1 Tax=Drosophila biarmipes TaxID=125945 RepID=UPI0007E60814|nr:peritrophin-48 [Drosophila biarmipes]
MDNLLLVLSLLLGTTIVSGIAYPDIALVCRILGVWQILPHEHNCQRFFVCTGDEELPFQEFSCPAEYHFSRKLMICVPGSCSDESLFCGLANSVQRVKGDCMRYRQCLEDGAFAVAKCSAGSYFDPGQRACLPVAITAEHQCSCVLPDNATLSNPGDCETYFRCHSGQAELVQCPSGDYFDEKVGSCLPDHTGICLEKPTMPPTLTEQALALDECIRTGSRLAPHSRDCQRYYVCARKRVLEMRCPRGQYFDAVQRYCSLDLGNDCQRERVEKAKQESEPEKEVAELNIPAKNKVKIEVHHPVQKNLEKEVVQLKKPQTDSNAKLPQSPLETVSSYDKFSSKFISF